MDLGPRKVDPKYPEQRAKISDLEKCQKVKSLKANEKPATISHFRMRFI